MMNLFLLLIYTLQFSFTAAFTTKFARSRGYGLQNPSTLLFDSIEKQPTTEGYTFEDYAEKRATFEPPTVTSAPIPELSNDDVNTPWPNYYCASSLQRSVTPETEIVGDTEKVIYSADKSVFVPVYKGKSLVVQTEINSDGDENSSYETSAVFVNYNSRLSDIIYKKEETESNTFPEEAQAIVSSIGAFNGSDYYALDISHIPDLDNKHSTEIQSILFETIESEKDIVQESFSETYSFQQLRSIGGIISDDHDAGILATARGLSVWHRSNRFCSKCGSPTASRKLGTSRMCVNSDCRARYYPRIDPSVIVQVTTSLSDMNGNEEDYILLGRKSVWPKNRYSVLAGFTEIGESLEETILREIKEESGVDIDRESIQYYSSQPWPFPRSLMIGFTSRVSNAANSTSALPKITVDYNEMEDVKFFSKREVREALRMNNQADAKLTIPGRASLAYHMITSWAFS